MGHPRRMKSPRRSKAPSLNGISGSGRVTPILYSPEISNYRTTEFENSPMNHFPLVESPRQIVSPEPEYTWKSWLWDKRCLWLLLVWERFIN